MARHRLRPAAPPVVRRALETTGSYLIYALILLSINFLSSVYAVNVDSDYKDAATLFEKRDIASCHRAIQLLEKNLETKADHLETQALISFAYAHEAFVLTQLGEKATEYQNSADAFSKSVLSQQPQNSYARKTSLILQLIAGNHIDVKKTLEKDISDKETDADIWYILATVSEGDKVTASLQKALSLNPDHVWIYNDMAFRAIKLGDLATAQKWANALEKRSANIADLDLLKAAIAALKKDKKTAELHWADFSKKAPDFFLVSKLSGTAGKKKPSTHKQSKTNISF